MSLEVFRERYRRLAKNTSSIAARIKADKFNALTERHYRELFGTGEASSEAISALPESGMLKWIDNIASSFPVNFNPSATDSASARLERANRNPSQREHKNIASPTMRLTEKQRNWIAKQPAEWRHAYANGSMHLPKWLLPDTADSVE